jgi:predicted HTH transcriptional regulator
MWIIDMRHWLNEEKSGPAAPQLKLKVKKLAVSHAKVTGRINNAQYRDMTGISARTALRELRQLTDLGIFAKVGGTGQSAHYVIAKAKPVIGKRGGNPS